MNMKKFSSYILTGLLTVCLLAVPAFASENTNSEGTENTTITIYYTNDIHTYIDNAVGDGNENQLSYSKIAGLKNASESALLVDAGDHVQGTAYGDLDDGATIIQIMNAAGYDLATLGNHEFDYDMEGCLQNIAAAEYPYVSCNFHHTENGVPGALVLDSNQIFEVDDEKIAFIGITTPETITSTTPAYFQNDAGEYIYGIFGKSGGDELYTVVQSAIDQAAAEGAETIIALGHLGVDLSSSPWTSREVIANTTGLDAFIDGHSHTTIAEEWVTDESGTPVLLTQTGSYMQAVGKMTIADDGTVSTVLLTGEDLADIEPDSAVKALEDAWIAEINSRLGQVIGYSEVVLDNFDTSGSRLVRKQETNTGDFAADALYYLFDSMGMDVDVAVMNGGGVRNMALQGELSYLSCKEIHTFGNVACLQTITGQQLLDALEWGASKLTADRSVENGGFLHVSGIRYTLDLTIPSTVQSDENGIWLAGPSGEYRVREVKVYDKDSDTYQPLDLTASYNLAGYNYTLRDLGVGFAMFNGAVDVLDYVAEDYMVLANYIQSFPVDSATGLPTISVDSEYADVNGTGRITILTEDTANPEEGQTNPDVETQTEADKDVVIDTETEIADEFYEVIPGDCLWNIANQYYGKGSLWDVIYQANRDRITDPNWIYIGQKLVIPALAQSGGR